MGAFSYENFIRSLCLLWILLLFVASYIYLPYIDRKVVFFFCNVILFVVIKLSIMENQEPTKIGAVIVIKQSIMEDEEPTKIDAAVVIKQSIMEDQEPTKSTVENQEATKIGAAVVIKQSTEEDQEPTKIGAAFDRGNEKKRRVVVSVELVEVENEEEEGKMRMGIDEKVSKAKDEKRDELQEKIEAFIENVKNQRRMEDLQLVTMSRKGWRKLKN